MSTPPEPAIRSVRCPDPACHWAVHGIPTAYTAARSEALAEHQAEEHALAASGMQPDTETHVMADDPAAPERLRRTADADAGPGRGGAAHIAAYTPDYQAAARTITRALELAEGTTLLSALAALELIDVNADFEEARDHDPAWPLKAEADAVKALRSMRDTRSEPGRTDKGTARTAALTNLRTFRNALEELATPGA